MNSSKVVLITGASSGIGEATARHLAARGARVVLGARRSERLEKLTTEIRAAGGVAEYRPLDVTRLDDREAFVACALKTHGQIDVIINIAGILTTQRLTAPRIHTHTHIYI